MSPRHAGAISRGNDDRAAAPVLGSEVTDEIFEVGLRSAASPSGSRSVCGGQGLLRSFGPVRPAIRADRRREPRAVARSRHRLRRLRLPQKALADTSQGQVNPSALSRRLHPRRRRPTGLQISRRRTTSLHQAARWSGSIGSARNRETACERPFGRVCDERVTLSRGPHSRADKDRDNCRHIRRRQPRKRFCRLVMTGKRETRGCGKCAVAQLIAHCVQSA